MNFKDPNAKWASAWTLYGKPGHVAHEWQNHRTAKEARARAELVMKQALRDPEMFAHYADE